jgi:hypothetical protein
MTEPLVKKRKDKSIYYYSVLSEETYVSYTQTSFEKVSNISSYYQNHSIISGLHNNGITRDYFLVSTEVQSSLLCSNNLVYDCTSVGVKKYKVINRSVITTRLVYIQEIKTTSLNSAYDDLFNIILKNL